MFLMILAVAALVQGGQDAAAPTPQSAPPVEAAPAPPPPTQGESWKKFSASSIRSYLLDVHGVKRDGEMAAVTVAQVPLNVADPSADHSYKLIDIEIQCSTHQSRVIAETPFDATGQKQDREELGESFAAYAVGGMDAAVATLLCEDQEPDGDDYPSIAAYIDGGRK